MKLENFRFHRRFYFFELHTLCGGLAKSEFFILTIRANKDAVCVYVCCYTCVCTQTQLKCLRVILACGRK